MAIFVYTNNASSLLASGITNSQTTLTVTATQGALFPVISAGQQAAIVVEDVNGNIEIMYATGRTSDTLTVVRGEEGTTALAFASGSRVEMRITTGVLQQLLQKTGGDTLSGTTTVSGVIQLGSGGSIQGGEFTGAVRSGPGVTVGQILVGGTTATQNGSTILTSANIGANMPAGSAVVVTNMIVGWAGLSSAIPAGWHLCDGTNGTTDLRDQFIVGGGGALPVSGNYSMATNAASAGTPTLNAVTLAIGNLPAHNHGNVIYAGSAGQVVGPPGTAAGADYFFGGSGGGTAINWNTGNTGSDTAFTPTAVALPGHTHTITDPPYVAVFMIMKL